MVKAQQTDTSRICSPNSKVVVHEHGKFDFALCAGDLFDGLKETSAVDEIRQRQEESRGELAKNVFLICKSGLVTTASGQRIAFLGGDAEPNIFSTSEVAPGFALPFVSVQTVDKPLSNSLTKATASSSTDQKSLTSIQYSSSSSQLVDIFMTNVWTVWPACITDFSFAPLPPLPSPRIGVPPLDDLGRRLKPRYHFFDGAPNGSREQPPISWERAPFVWDEKNGNGRVSRFISLGVFRDTYDRV
ncbi:hypothetical protein EV360DRAFT_81659 [Lentinula raphanica]|nr:hypothetical protein EV360DRAFT_81659 [Lentinula raphanica]